MELPEKVTSAWLNSLEPKDRIEVLRGPFGQRMHRWAGSYVTYIRYATRMTFGTKLNSASVFFLDLGGRLLAVTAAHVYQNYLGKKRRYRHVQCQIENVPFDPEARLRGLGDGVDIATFDFSYDDLMRMGKQALIGNMAKWPPVHPFSGQGLTLAGFPAASRLWIGWRAMSFGLYTAGAVVNAATDRQITCPFDRDYWIDSTGYGLPPRGYDLGGLSGGPALASYDTDGVWRFELAGVISETPSSPHYETVVSAPAHFIASDGTIHNDDHAPVLHAIPAGQGT